MGQQFYQYVLETINKMQVILPPEPEPTIMLEADGWVLKMDEIKYGMMYDQWLTRTKKAKKEMKQIYSIYYRQCDEDIKSGLAKNPLLRLYNILQISKCQFHQGLDYIVLISGSYMIKGYSRMCMYTW